MMIMFSGAGHVVRRSKPPGRMIERDCAPVGADYEPDIIEYKEGYWAQYGVATLFCWGFFLACVAWCSMNLYAMGLLVWVLGVIIPGSFLLPLWWMRTYRRPRRIFEGLDEKTKPTSVQEVME